MNSKLVFAIETIFQHYKLARYSFSTLLSFVPTPAGNGLHHVDPEDRNLYTLSVEMLESTFLYLLFLLLVETITCGTSLSKAIRDFSNFTIFYSFDLKKKYRMCLRIIFRLKTFQFHLIFHWYSKVCTRFIYIQNCLLKLSDSGNCEY